MVMKTFMKNVRRSMLKNKKSFMGAIAIIGIGIFILIAMNDVMHNLEDSVNVYYEQAHFAQVFAKVKEIPISEVETLKDIEGINQSFGRLAYDARMKLEAADEIVTVHLLAYDKQDSLNQLLLVDKSVSIQEDCIYLGSKMQSIYQFKPYDEIELVLGTKTYAFKYIGEMKAPEYIYTVSPGAEMPDGEIYDVVAINKSQLEKLLGKEGKVTEIGVCLEPGYTYEDVQYELTQKLAPYGLISLCDREKQPSNNMLQNELNQLYTMGSALPVIFMVISIFMMYIVLKKMISQDRSLIGTMKAFGFTDKQLILAYMKQSVLIGALGWLIGCIGAKPFGEAMFNMYRDYFDLPNDVYHTYITTKGVGLIVAIGTSVIATYLGILDVLKINPAESMRQVVPHVSTIKMPKCIERILNARQKIGMRSIVRSKFRSFVIAFSIAFPFGMLAVLSAFPSVMAGTFKQELEVAKTYDLKLVFNETQPMHRAIESAKRLKYTYNVEGIFEYATLLHHENRQEIGTIIAIDENSRNYHILDIDGKVYDLNKEGVIITQGLANKLNLQVGDCIVIDDKRLSYNEVKIPISKVIVQSIGEGVYMSRDKLNTYFDLKDQVTGILLNCEKDHMQDVKKQIKSTQSVTFIIDSQKMLSNYEVLMSSMVGMVEMFKIISIIVGIIIIYNISNITIRERKNEFGTLQVLGMTAHEICEIISFEQGVNFIAGILMGIPMSWVLKVLLSKVIATDSYTLKIVVPFSNYVQAGIVCVVIMVVAVFSMLQIIKKIEPTDVLKERE